MKNFDNKTIVITGAGSGIGRALAQAFANLGAKLALNDIDKKQLQATVASLPKNTPTLPLAFDVSDMEAMNNFADITLQKFGKIEVLINNAGVSAGKISVEDTDIKLFKWVMDINFWGTVNGTKAFLPYLKKQQEAVIVNLSSVFGLMGIGYQAPYCTSKFAVRAFSEALAVELHNTPVHTLCVFPAGVKTNIANNAKGITEFDKQEFSKLLIAEPDAIAQKIIKGIKRKKHRITIGLGASTIDWVNRLKPYHIANFFQQISLKIQAKNEAKFK